MEEPAVRDIDRWKDKIEVRLDNRQVFFLFFGSAVVACMLFVLGVIVGKRIESRGRAEAPEVQDPLAVLDRAGQPAPATPPAARAELTFPRTLTNTSPRARTTARTVAAAPRPEPLKAAAAAASPKPEPVKAAAASPAPKPEPLKAAAATPSPKPEPAKAAALKAEPVKAALRPPALAKAPPAAPDPAKAVKGKFTLQLSAFPTRDEADAFARKYPGAFVIVSAIPGKGTWYRVRCGNYASFQDATAAKASFEKQNRVIALVAGR
jgi:DedD protein